MSDRPDPTRSVASTNTRQDPAALPDDGFRGWVLYDDHCGFCRKWVPMFRRTLAKRRIGVSPNQVAWALEALGLERGQTPGDICLLMRDGTTMLGAEAYRYVMRRIWWATPMYVLSVLPVGRWCFNACYRMFKNNRYRFSKACGLPGVDELKTDKAQP